MPAHAPTPNPAAASDLKQRLKGLTQRQAETMRRVMQLQAAGDRLMAGQWLLQLANEAPDHPEVLLGLAQQSREAGDWPLAAARLLRATERRPDDPRLWLQLAQAQAEADDPSGAQRSLAAAAACTRSASDWLELSQECDRQGHYDMALGAAEAHLARSPDSAPGLLQRSRCHKALGHSEPAAADCRRLIAQGREAARAWFALVDLKTVPLQPAELEQLAAASRRGTAPADEQALLDFALGGALEAAGRPAEALQALQQANAGVRRTLPWNAAVFAQQMQALEAAFSGPVARSEAAQGEEVIFLVGLPRSGSTLVEQVLASHPQVEGASELPYLQQVIEEESQRRRRPFLQWATDARATDWTRLGRDYLRRSARWRQQRPIATDKLPDNWLYTGALRAMLPGARIIDCRREALQTCWSCYKQLFGPGLAAYSYDFESLAQFAVACERSGDAWAAREPAHVRVQHYEALIQDAEREIRALLAFCGLPFDAVCLNAHAAQRAIRTPSALQVRQPMKRISAPADAYGELLAPLRDALVRARQQDRANPDCKLGVW
ncbi:tetratricopeptide repeat-containing sulfotransferase family protein [Rubrivivax rivuli]|uniref:Sulfotransferase n=1 Tax=Rubrivivax rivuli TaxID=1862385 RepID=A0A437RRY9_9BURK|nr:sulfotransferase [Rubrivivax rivuli]RVU49549.1 sulfotransferase [Rubrivivax rivuli]